MTSRWYRSRLFWSGLAGLVMLLILWGTPPRTEVTAELATLHAEYGFRKSTRSISFHYSERRFIGYAALTPPLGWRVYRGWQGASWVPPRLFAPAFRYRGTPALGWSVHIGIWFVILLYTTIWYGGMIFWLRRKHGLMLDPLGQGKPPGGDEGGKDLRS